MSRGPRSQPRAGVRPGVWLAAAALLVTAFGLARGLSPSGDAGRSSVAQSQREATPAPIGEPARVEVALSEAAPLGPAGAAARTAVDDRLGLEDALDLQPAPQTDAPRAVAMERVDAPGDSHIAAEIRVLEREAERVAASLELLPDWPHRSRGDAAGEDARAQSAADALLVEHFVQDAYRGTLFPARFPAEQRTRAAAESQVRALTPEMRRDLLDVVLQSGELAERVGPEFAPLDSGFVWENASR